MTLLMVYDRMSIICSLILSQNKNESLSAIRIYYLSVFVSNYSEPTPIQDKSQPSRITKFCFPLRWNLLCDVSAYPESKEKRGENSDFWFLGRTVRADIFGRIYLGSKKFSQMAAFVGKSKNIESSLNLNNYCQISFQLACLT